MKTLHLLRHAKSSWKDPMLSDIDRPLKKRGRRDARLMASAMLESGWRPQAVFCSTALRARQTITEVLETVGVQAAGVVYSRELYAFDFRSLLEWLSGRQEDELTIVGHNPALFDLIEWLTAESLSAFPTGAYCRLQLELDNWRQFSKGSGKATLLLRAKLLRAE
jgi:phosphohistidine phosphatase